MTKKGLVDKFCEDLKRIRIPYKRYGVFHVQVSSVHNFYPSKGTYYNSELNYKDHYLDKILKNHEAFMEFIRQFNSSKKFAEEHRDLFIEFGKFAKNYKSPKNVEEAFNNWIEK